MGVTYLQNHTRLTHAGAPDGQAFLMSVPGDPLQDKNMSYSIYYLLFSRCNRNILTHDLHKHSRIPPT